MQNCCENENRENALREIFNNFMKFFSQIEITLVTVLIGLIVVVYFRYLT